MTEPSEAYRQALKRQRLRDNEIARKTTERLEGYKAGFTDYKNALIRVRKNLRVSIALLDQGRADVARKTIAELLNDVEACALGEDEA